MAPPAKVMQICKKDTQRAYAGKTIRQAHISSRPGRSVASSRAERTVFALFNKTFIVLLKRTQINCTSSCLSVSLPLRLVVCVYHHCGLLSND